MILSFRTLNAIGLVGSLLLCGLVQVMGTAAAAVDTTRPYLVISSPSNGATITATSGKITVKGSATDAGSGIANVWVRLDREQFAAVTPKAPNDWSSWTASLTVSGGYHNITAKARDNSGNERWRTVTVEVQDAENDIPRAIRTVTADSIGTLMAAISNARPGDHIVLRNGIYDNTSWLTSRGLKNMLVRGIDGTAEAPIVISVETIGGVEIRGPGGFRFDDVAHLIVRGFRFAHSQDNAGSSDDTAIQCDLCSNVRFTRNQFELNTSSRISADWLSISSGQSDHNRIDHNSFKNKTTRGVFLLIFGKHTVVDHNYFYNHNYSGGNGGECIRIGNSENGLVDYYSRIEYNLFEKCNGDMEAVSVKSSSNTFKANTFRHNEGSLTFRHGNNNIADGNFFLSGENGIRSYGHDHLIVNNYFGSLTGTGSLTPLVIGSGTVEEDLSRSNSEHSRSKNVVVAFNTFYNNQDTYLRIGEDFRSLAPVDITVAHNILAGSSGTLVAYDEGQEIVWSKNILYGSASKGNMPSSGFVSVNPQLTAKAGGIYGISSTSPAIDKASASSFASVVTDMDGQTRSGMKDTGADEYSSSGIRSRPLSASGVGPAS